MLRKFINKRSLMILGGGLLIVPAVVLAYTSANFSSRAQAWATATCTKSLINSRDTLANNRTATICYEYFKNQEQDTAIASANTNIQSNTSSISSLSSQISNVQNSQTPPLIDANGDVLGTLITPGYDSGYGEFYNTTLGRNVDYSDTTGQLSENGGGGSLEFSYQSSNCSGQPYVYVYPGFAYLELFVTNSKQTYIVQNGANPVVFAPGSQSSGGSQCTQLQGSSPNTYYPLTSTSLPFPDPLPLPLSYK